MENPSIEEGKIARQIEIHDQSNPNLKKYSFNRIQATG